MKEQLLLSLSDTRRHWPNTGFRWLWRETRILFLHFFPLCLPVSLSFFLLILLYFFLYYCILLFLWSFLYSLHFNLSFLIFLPLHFNLSVVPFIPSFLPDFICSSPGPFFLFLNTWAALPFILSFLSFPPAFFPSFFVFPSSSHLVLSFF